MHRKILAKWGKLIPPIYIGDNMLTNKEYNNLTAKQLENMGKGLYNYQVDIISANSNNAVKLYEYNRKQIPKYVNELIPVKHIPYKIKYQVYCNYVKALKHNDHKALKEIDTQIKRYSNRKTKPLSYYQLLKAGE